MRYALAITVVVAGCASPPGQSSWPGSSPDSNTKAVSSLVENARSDASAGRLENAAASMERAIRLAPRNARLWQELARLRLKQGEYAQAENVALRSNTLTRGDSALRVENWHIIAQAREARGDAAGARSARELAKRIEY
jgi:Tfp pilus assembly protein PilF